MKYGETYKTTARNIITGKTYIVDACYKRTSWNDWHTNDDGDGLWNGDRQVLGTCQFTVRGCRTEQGAKAKIRNYAKTR